MQTVLQQAVREGRERGVQLAVYHNNELVVDTWAGLADAATGTAVDGDTLFPVFSVTKAMAATIMHRLVERGHVGYETPVADVWPEFGAHGKQGITVRHVLSHTAGLPCLPMGIGYVELCDWPAMCTAIAQQRPQTPPGWHMAYHAVTFGWLVGEVARRVDGRSFQQLLKEEICDCAGITDMYTGIPESVTPRVAVLQEIFAHGQAPSCDDSVPRDIPGWMQPLAEMMNRPDARRACIPASNGIMSARAIARHYAALLPGGVDGVELLPPERVRAATVRQLPGDGREALPMGLGYFLGNGVVENGDEMAAFGHGGYGGSTGFASGKHRLAVGFTKNLFSPAGAQQDILRALILALKIGQA